MTTVAVILQRAPTKGENLAAIEAATQLIGMLLLLWGVIYFVRRSRRKR
jgi:hypothetical protein